MMVQKIWATLIGGTKARPTHLHQILELGAVVDEDHHSLCLEAPPKGLLVVEVAAFHLECLMINCTRV